MLKNKTKKTHPNEGENGDYLFSEINNPAFEEAMTSAIARIMEDRKTQTDSLSKLLVLETALEYFLKAESGEKLEYLKSGEPFPKNTPVHVTSRGARGYYPSEIGRRDEIEAQGGAVGRSELEPDEERELVAVTPQTFSFKPYHGSMDSVDDINLYFDDVSLYLDTYLQQELGRAFKPYLGKSTDASLLTVDNIQKAGFTDGSKEGAGEPTGLGINNIQNWTVEIEGQPFIYKLVTGENQAEILSYTLDRVLGLNIVPYTKSHSIDIEGLADIVADSQNLEEVPDIINDLSELQRIGTGGDAGGHFQEFCDNCLGSDERVPVMAEMLTTKEGREEFFKIQLLDIIIGNYDRHDKNYLITKDKRIVAIDNGMIGDGEELGEHQENKRLILSGEKFDDQINDVDMQFPYWMAKQLWDNVGKDEVTKISNIDTLVTEAENMFDKYFTKDKKKLLDNALSISEWSIDVDFEEFRQKFTEHAARTIQKGIIGQSSSVFFPVHASESMKQLHV